jgi:hypothetical protein
VRADKEESLMQPRKINSVGVYVVMALVGAALLFGVGYRMGKDLALGEKPAVAATANP